MHAKENQQDKPSFNYETFLRKFNGKGTRGPVELLPQSTVLTNLNLEINATTTGDAENGRKDCVSQLEALERTGPRQTASLDFSLSQDWSSQTWERVESQ